MSAALQPITPQEPIPGQLILDEIQVIVAEAIAMGGTLQIRPYVDRLLKVYEGAGFSKSWIANELIRSAASAKVPLEL